MINIFHINFFSITTKQIWNVWYTLLKIFLRFHFYSLSSLCSPIQITVYFDSNVPEKPSSSFHQINKTQSKKLRTETSTRGTLKHLISYVNYISLITWRTLNCFCVLLINSWRLLMRHWWVPQEELSQRWIMLTSLKKPVYYEK